MSNLMLNYKLFLDDVRPLPDETWMLATDYDTAVIFFETCGCPSMISFDHDLGEDSSSGKDVAAYLVNKDQDCGGSFIPDSFQYTTHSANPVGRDNIKALLDGYLAFRENELGRH